MCATSLLIVLLVGHVLPASSSTPETRQDDISGNMLPCTARSHGERLPCLATQIRLSLAMELKGFGAEITVVEKSQLQQVLDALSSAQQLVKGILKRLPAAARHLLVRSASRQMLQADPCAACVPAAPCYSLSCKDGKMDTDAPFKACADAQGVCNACYPNSACGSLPTGSTRSPTPTPMPSWVGCVDKSDEVVSQAAKAWGFNSYSCARGKTEGACGLAVAAELCPVTCGHCRTLPHIHLPLSTRIPRSTCTHVHRGVFSLQMSIRTSFHMPIRMATH